MGKTREIQRRIKSIKSTKKITRAMEMVAAAKMRKATEAVLKTRTYANLSWITVLNLSKAANINKSEHPLLETHKKIDRVAMVLLASNRGLCGGYNSAVMQKAHESIRKHQFDGNKEVVPTDFIILGKKGMAIHSRYKYNIVAEFEKADVASEVMEVVPVTDMIMSDYIAKKYDKVMIAFTDYISATKQQPRVKQLLPIDIGAEKDHYGILGIDTRVGMDKDFLQAKEDKYLKDRPDESGKWKDNYLFAFEPSADEVLEKMLPRLIEIQLFQALLESNASEHSARMAAMHQANEAAGDLISQLTLYYNKARQAAITNEIAEISAGAEALK